MPNSSCCNVSSAKRFPISSSNIQAEIITRVHSIAAIREKELHVMQAPRKPELSYSTIDYVRRRILEVLPCEAV